MKRCASSMTPRKKIFRMSRCQRPMEDTVMAKVNRKKRPTRIIMGIFRLRTTFTSSTLRLTRANRKHKMMRTATLSIQKATFSERNQQGDKELKVSSNINSNNPARQIAARNNILRITDTTASTKLTSIRMNIANSLKNSKRSFTTGTSGTTLTSTKQRIIGPTSKRIGTRFRQTLSEEPNALQSLASTILKKIPPFTPRIEATHKKT